MYFLFNRTTLQVSITHPTGALYVHPLWFYKHQHDNRVRSKLFVACQRWWFQWRFWFVPSVPGYLREEEEHKPDPWRNPIERNHMGLHLECTVYDPDNHFEYTCTDIRYETTQSTEERIYTAVETWKFSYITCIWLKDRGSIGLLWTTFAFPFSINGGGISWPRKQLWNSEWKIRCLINLLFYGFLQVLIHSLRVFPSVLFIYLLPIILPHASLH